MTTSANKFSMNEPSGKQLTDETHQVLLSTDVSNRKPGFDALQEEYDNAVNDLNKLKEKIAKQTNDYFSRVDPKNKYLGKNIQIGDKILYVTNNGVAKLYPNTDVFNANAGNYGCPASSEVLKMVFPWSNDYSSPGAVLPTTPQLIIGTPMTKGQACGNEGSNVYVNSLVNNPTSSYLGCYNNQAPSQDVLVSPRMNASNNVNGVITQATSVWSFNNDFTGPWRAFDGDANTFWHSNDSNPNINYDSNTGVYKGTYSTPFHNKSGQYVNAIGEHLYILFTQSAPFPLTKYSVQGRQGCCGDPNGRDPNTWYILGYNTQKPGDGWVEIDYQSNVSFNWQKRSFTVQDAKPCNFYVFVITVAGAPTAKDYRNSVQISTWDLYTSSNTTASNPAMKNVGKMDIESCQSYALNSGNQYFGLQSTDSNGIGNCMVSNDLASSQMYGKASDFKMMPVWATATNNSGATATLTNTGSLSVLNSASSSVYATSNPSSGGGYVGCYGDRGDRAMDASVIKVFTSGVGRPEGPYDWSMTVDKCRTTAINNKYDYYAIQAGSVCFLSNDINKTMKYGKVGNCGGSGNNITGGGWANAVYSVKQTGNYFLILQDDGNLVIYKGKNPSDNQGAIWSTGTNGKQQQSNPVFAASKGKYGQNWMPSGSSLAPNEFIGSNKGDMALIMQTDGNLVLYTFTANISCKAMSNGKTSGADGINALYQLKDIGVPSNVGNLGYVDENDMLHPYPSSNSENGAGYSKFGSTNIGSNDITTVRGTVQECQSACDNNSSCTGFVYVGGSSNTGYLKSASSYSSKFPSVGTDVYVKNKIPKNLPIGVASTTNNIDSITYQKYINGGPPASDYGLAKATTVQQKQLEQLEQRVNMLSKQMTNNNTDLKGDKTVVLNQTVKNMNGLNNYVSNIIDTQQQIKEGFDSKNNDNNNVDNLLTDSDITVLQQNYDYLFWSILATGTVLVSMSVLK